MTQIVANQRAKAVAGDMSTCHHTLNDMAWKDFCPDCPSFRESKRDVEHGCQVDGS